jgi:hypothetical protein
MTPYFWISSFGVTYRSDDPERMLPSGTGIRVDRRPPRRRGGRRG